MFPGGFDFLLGDFARLEVLPGGFDFLLVDFAGLGVLPCELDFLPGDVAGPGKPEMTSTARQAIKITIIS